MILCYDSLTHKHHNSDIYFEIQNIIFFKETLKLHFPFSTT